MPTVVEGGLTFDFPAGWDVEQYDRTTHYTGFQSLANSKAVDIVALSPAPTRELWLIEVKDYRATNRTKGIDLLDEICLKVRDTLAGLYMAQRKATAGSLNALAVAADETVRVRVAFHLEQVRTPSRLRPVVVERANHRKKLRQVLRTVDSKAEVCEIDSMPPAIGWTVS